ncbi:hypothetical protein PUNSTDRAFT_131379 [Punctularia strigosozonata HHB-11173 SS5]|uniref:uncharacterized protein n=1 Tax=Punctularia strigosozonata (strain HHB-11173) TaxID=741275 RepID=UPI0004417913|nr:uncharacterized protein PUNSTDRAFT_131379 [Punctularia strigosozonata HHB-11173 SS5]EIN11201.1 hypothetical protein PUNSTDRAFT_131379 [Punctularia strigosozonata HHB-11173 SS5]
MFKLLYTVLLGTAVLTAYAVDAPDLTTAPSASPTVTCPPCNTAPTTTESCSVDAAAHSTSCTTKTIFPTCTFLCSASATSTNA